MDAEAVLREKIVASARAMNVLGINQGAAGNLSARCGPDMLITPSGVAYEKLTPAMIAKMPLADEGETPRWSGPAKPSSEWRFHRDILRRRPDVGAIVHTHALYATVLSMLRRNLPASHYMIAAFGAPQIVCTDYAPFGTQALSDLAVAGLGAANGVLLGSHGMIAVGPHLERALWLAGELETLAKMHYLASLAGVPALVPDAEIATLVDKFKAYGPGA